MKRMCVWLIGVCFFSGCVAGQVVPLNYSPVSAADIGSLNVISVKVQDRRDFILNRSKPDSYIGHFRAGFGNTWNVYTSGRAPLADVVCRDIVKELKSLGFGTKISNGDREIDIEIVDYNFDAYTNTRFWYDFRLIVKSAGSVIYEKTYKSEHVIKGSVWIGPVKAVRAQMPQLYAGLIRDMIRNDKELIAAIK